MSLLCFFHLSMHSSRFLFCSCMLTNTRTYFESLDGNTNVGMYIFYPKKNDLNSIRRERKIIFP